MAFKKSKPGQLTSLHPGPRPTLDGPLAVADYHRTVETIRITIHTTGLFFESDTRSGNHASIFLLTVGGGSIRLDVYKRTSVDTMGTYRQQVCNYQESRTAVTSFDVQPSRGLKVHHVIDLITNKGRDRYRLAPSGLGCRFWVFTVINDLNAAGQISTSSPVSAADVGQRLRYNYTVEQAPQFEDFARGRFV
ncbi:MAG: hypothetical protein M4579_007291 [Chaenotheca gracillima]|nr:MAG: hypothetical protein M4579_007291 [Chaenotheca gracillima]